MTVSRSSLFDDDFDDLFAPASSYEGLPEIDDFEGLVDVALEDRTLRQQSLTAGLSRSDLCSYLQENPPEFDAVGIDERAKVQLLREEVRKASRTLEVQGGRLAELKRIAGVVGSVLLAALFALAIVLADREAFGPAAGLFILFLAGGIWLVNLLLAWPPAWLSGGQSALAHEIRTLKAELPSAERALRLVQIEAGLKPALRTCINSRAVGKYRTTLTVVEQEGLAELEDPRYAIPTKARTQLDQFLNDMPGGSIGLAGPRGVGKTTLIRTVCPTPAGGLEDRLGFVVSAPVQFDPREFLLHLFAEACRGVLGPREVERLRSRHATVAPAPHPFFESLFSGWRAAGLLTGLLLILVTLTTWVALGLVLGLVSVTLAVVSAWPGLSTAYRELVLGEIQRGAEDLPGSDLETVAAARLEDIWYQQTFTTGWSGGLKTAVAQAGLEGGRELAKQQMTLPDIVAEFRRLLSRMSRHHKVYIGIDELDKIESRTDAYRFMNELKVLFGIPNCFFLISVSEDAMSSFERRGMPFRDVFDSSFDDVVNVSFLDVDESIQLVERRVVGMPMPFIFLCHCIAGGLARDLIRVAREIIGSNPGQEEGWPVHEACEAILKADLAAKVAAALIATRAMVPGRAVEQLRGWLQDLRDLPVSAEALMAICHDQGASLLKQLAAEAAPANGAAPSPHMLAEEILTFVFYASCLLEFFALEKDPSAYEAAYEDGHIERLTHARQALAIHPRVAWEALRDLRGADRTRPYPIPLRGAPA